jgi:uncharacterized protein YndB with AHSA1/START domain
MRKIHLVWAGSLIALIAALLLPLPWAHTTYIHTVVDIKRPPSEVFDYVTTPGNWPRWHPSSLAVRGNIDHPLILGEQVTEDFLVAGRRGTVVWTVIAYQPGRQWAIEGKVAGGGQGVVSYIITPTESGSRFERNFRYNFRNLLLIILDQVEIRRRVEQESSEALRRLKGCLEKPTVPAQAHISHSRLTHRGRFLWMAVQLRIDACIGLEICESRDAYDPTV